MQKRVYFKEDSANCDGFIFPEKFKRIARELGARFVEGNNNSGSDCRDVLGIYSFGNAKINYLFTQPYGLNLDKRMEAVIIEGEDKDIKTLENMLKSRLS